jgi:hypothetical protein
MRLKHCIIQTTAVRVGFKSRSENPINKLLKPVGTLSTAGQCEGMKFFSNGVGYLGLCRGGISKSIDGGVKFDAEIVDGCSLFPVPDFINSNEGYVIFNSNTIYDYNTLYHTINGGKDWTPIITANNLKSLLEK